MSSDDVLPFLALVRLVGRIDPPLVGRFVARALAGLVHPLLRRVASGLVDVFLAAFPLVVAHFTSLRKSEGALRRLRELRRQAVPGYMPPSSEPPPMPPPSEPPPMPPPSEPPPMP